MPKPRLKHGTRDYAQKAADVSLATPRWDHGSKGPANRAGLVKEPRGYTDPETGETRNPNNVTGVRRLDLLDRLHRDGTISDRGYKAGSHLRAAWAETQRSKSVDLSDVRVDQTSKPDAAIDIRIERISRLRGISRHIANGDGPIIYAAIYDERDVSDQAAWLRDALDRMADSMGV